MTFYRKSGGLGETEIQLTIECSDVVILASSLFQRVDSLDSIMQLCINYSDRFVSRVFIIDAYRRWFVWPRSTWAFIIKRLEAGDVSCGTIWVVTYQQIRKTKKKRIHVKKSLHSDHVKRYDKAILKATTTTTTRIEDIVSNMYIDLWILLRIVPKT